jgi:hypothetical protein
MKCRDFERLIHEQLDARDTASPTIDAALAGHAAVCPACRAMALRYATLRQAIAAWAMNPPSPPADFALRFPADWAASERGEPVTNGRPLPLTRRLAAFRTLAAAAVLLVAVGLGIRAGWPRRPARPTRIPSPSARPIDSGALSTAFAEARSATWELARTTSGPAARVGLEVLDATTLADSPPPLAIPGTVGPVPASEVLQDVGRRVNDEVAPLSVTARHAFGFLIGQGGG